MKYSSVQYATALHDLARETPHAKRRGMIREFLATVAKSGALSLLPEIVRTLARMQREARGVREVSVRTHERTSELALKRKLRFRADLSLIKDVLVRGGAIVESEGVRVDNSIAKRMGRLRDALASNH